MRALADKKQQAAHKAKKMRFEQGKDLSPAGLFARRLFHRAEARVETLPPFFGTMASLSFLAAFALYGMSLSGYLKSGLSDATASIGFDVKAVTISGQANLHEQDILDVLNLKAGTSLVTFNVARAHRTLLRQPWVKSASVRKIYPGRLEIKLSERKPFAVWQRGQIRSVIDEEGRVLDAYNETIHTDLPMFVGHDAQKRGAEFWAVMDDFPLFSSRVKASMLRSGRRWDVLLDNAVTVKLPETNMRAAIARLVELDANDGILSKDVLSIDLRLPDRLVVRLPEDVMVNRNTVLKERREARESERRI